MTYGLLFAALGVAVVVYAILRSRRDSAIGRLLDKSVETGDPAPLVEALEKLPAQRRSFLYQRAITTLWSTWQRPLAIKVIRAFGERHSDEKISQFWMKQALEVEPNEARKSLDERFLRDFFRPEVAKQCGLTSS